MGQTLLEALNVRMVGSGKKFLVLAHGFGTDQSNYFDFRRYTTLEPYVDDLLHIVVSLGVDRCAYIGHSVSALIGILASIRHPELFSKLILIGASPRFLNDQGYHGGFEQGEIENVFSSMEANYEAWVNGFAPLAVGADVSAAVREFSRTLFNMRLDISFFVSRRFAHFDNSGTKLIMEIKCSQAID